MYPRLNPRDKWIKEGWRMGRVKVNLARNLYKRVEQAREWGFVFPVVELVVTEMLIRDIPIDARVDMDFFYSAALQRNWSDYLWQTAECKKEEEKDQKEKADNERKERLQKLREEWMQTNSIGFVQPEDTDVDEEGIVGWQVMEPSANLSDFGVGARLAIQMGFIPGRGLGRDEHGILTPIQASSQNSFVN